MPVAARGSSAPPLWGSTFAPSPGAAPGRRPGPPQWGGGHDLTRYLCAAVYLDREYAKSLVKEVAAEPHLGVATAPACDVPVVLRHAYRANARRYNRDLLLAALLLAFLLVYSSGAPSGSLLLPLILFVAWGALFSFKLSTKYGSHLQDLRPDRFDPATAPSPLSPSIAARLQEIGQYAQGNVTTYSGYSPFIGYGTELESWSLSFDVTTSSGAGVTAQDFDVTELYAHIAQRVGKLSLPCLEIEERLFVDGETVLEDQRFLPDPLGRPVASVSPGRMDDLKRVPEEGARPYLVVHSTGWGGELVTSLFLRFFRSDSNLSVEAVQTVLCPLLDRYRVIDTLLPRPPVREVVALLGQTLVTLPFVLLASPLRVVDGASRDYWLSWRLRRQEKLITQLRRFDYGARQSVRQRAADRKHHRFFQKADSGMVLKTVEKRVLDALVEFAMARGIDVDELVQRQDVIINNGIIATQGARVDSSSVASGAKSRVAMNILQKIT
ncbi:zinc ribbon domain-containing protein [Streptomyces sp. B-S-A8]|uniref:Zinc ribbon domain-containing protein n=1 Tax=Streptomyces solicavernae TaxID=3043614 RepID=A0ABT6RM76_9ACTN|nr:zinc ribbon domain-containing protein [Streptomyces sp. B-S-A8]MDI3385528.1 zinc ribbon domain-containing protein [Streptomyces sp. B-S-A8]